MPTRKKKSYLWKAESHNLPHTILEAYKNGHGTETVVAFLCSGVDLLSVYINLCSGYIFLRPRSCSLEPKLWIG